MLAKLRRHWHARMWLRGTSWLGIANTVAAIIINRIWVRHAVVDGHYYRTIGWECIPATDWPPEGRITEVPTL